MYLDYDSHNNKPDNTQLVRREMMCHKIYNIIQSATFPGLFFEDEIFFTHDIMDVVDTLYGNKELYYELDTKFRRKWKNIKNKVENWLNQKNVDLFFENKINMITERETITLNFGGIKLGKASGKVTKNVKKEAIDQSLKKLYLLEFYLNQVKRENDIINTKTEYFTSPNDNSILRNTVGGERFQEYSGSDDGENSQYTPDYDASTHENIKLRYSELDGYSIPFDLTKDIKKYGPPNKNTPTGFIKVQLLELLIREYRKGILANTASICTYINYISLINGESKNKHFQWGRFEELLRYGKNSKQVLYSMINGNSLPITYESVKVAKNNYVAVCLQANVIIGAGDGPSMKLSQQHAASDALFR
ncbi:hypothetical protein TBLA_0I00785 [Henningerozyma blattae CBS 6284]|uniref:Uncharacterized protein n=1 Tax=Henningerozyma blattae (strain ATCC 34711 / CBS 6284 / DSM 70876 / NBRC 10599 / NRRL Y-10934 / UCD 77-7) TaxID=1071380 RepID=I2H8N5_HENB6|nr:hypothetical protein TBLA_0I00785 [Tetrapisispora blattae CBS 6284]CCH62737.1 hypothetical protein TBLA_0I00785 [Tetrapisispora blattae CBS 6284]